MATMKSIEEKAKAYDEALKVLHRYDGANIMFSQSLKEEMFPELKESEDEKIKREIIEYVKIGTYHKDWIVWLEKQGEQKSTDEEMKVLLRTEYEKGRADAIAEKPWSEEDEETLKDIITSMTNLKDSATSDALRDIYNSKIDWLKSLKDRVQPQPKQEWSEEDKCMLNNVIDTLKPLSQTTHSGYAINSMIDWLKSLRPQTTWKPSDEQMKAIEKTLKYFRMINAFGETIDGLKELEEQLKKLREE